MTGRREGRDILGEELPSQNIHAPEQSTGWGPWALICKPGLSGPEMGPGCGLERGTTQEKWWQVELPPIPCCVFPLTVEGSWTHLLSWGPVDLVVSNPPYIFHQDMEQLAPEIRRCRVCWEGGWAREGLVGCD